jgi:hypothetical protein
MLSFKISIFESTAKKGISANKSNDFVMKPGYIRCTAYHGKTIVSDDF